MKGYGALQDRSAILTELQYDTFSIILFFISVSVWISILLSDVITRSIQTKAIALGVAVEAVCGVCFWIRSHHFRLASYCLVVGIWTCNALAVQRLEQPAFLFLFPFICMIAGALLRDWAAFGVAAVSSAFMFSLSATGVALQGIVVPALMSWFASSITFSISRGLYEALSIAWSYQDYATEQMLDSREQRAQLARIAKSLQETQHDLERANTQLHHAQNAAEEARRLKAQFAANVSHELRTPINLIVGFSEMMVMAPEAYGGPLPSMYRADLHAIYRNGRHLQSLINDVLDISQIEAGRMIVVKEKADPRQVILEAVELARDLIASQGLAFEVHIPDTLPELPLDRTRTRQVILNLLSNATRFTDQGQITLRAVVKDGCLEISVSDTGIGIRPEDFERVFEEFRQLDGSLSRRKGGTGLGLALSRQFVRLHGGHMWVESEGAPGKGSTFFLTLPLEERTAAQRSPLESGPVDMENGTRYFVVLDDDPAIVQLFERYTSKHQAIGVHTDEEAARLIGRIQPTALVIDGKHASTATIKMALRDQTPVILCPMPSGRRAVQTYGVADYLVKPVSREALLDTLARLEQPIRTVLVIDDDRDIVRMFSRMLRASPQAYEVRQAYSGREGLALMRRQRPDAVVLDILMPDVDGFAVVQHMKTDPLLADIPIVLISARGAGDAILSSTDGELSMHKSTGFQPVELVRCVEALVDAITPATAQAC